MKNSKHNTQKPDPWIASAQRLAKKFAAKHEVLLDLSERQLSAAFEVGCFHALLKFYENQGYQIKPWNLGKSGEYRYLTSPTGNPANFSYIELSGEDGEFELRQQIRVESHIDEDIRFTPDMAVIEKGAVIHTSKHKDYAGGKKSFYRVQSNFVVAAHECKSLNPFPELLVSFLGMFVTAHAWFPDGKSVEHTDDEGHLAPTLFIGGSARALHLRMINAMQSNYQINIVCGIHQGTWGLEDAGNRLIWK